MVDSAHLRSPDHRCKNAISNYTADVVQVKVPSLWSLGEHGSHSTVHCGDLPDCDCPTGSRPFRGAGTKSEYVFETTSRGVKNNDSCRREWLGWRVLSRGQREVGGLGARPRSGGQCGFRAMFGFWTHAGFIFRLVRKSNNLGMWLNSCEIGGILSITDVPWIFHLQVSKRFRNNRSCLNLTFPGTLQTFAMSGDLF
jgi:hypothetical protein